MLWTLEQIFCEDILRNEVIQDCSRGKFDGSTFPNRSQIFKLIKNFETYGTCRDCWAMGSSTSELQIQTITQKEYAHVIQNFACCI